MVVIAATPSDEQMKERLFRWHIANCEFASAAEVKDLSVRSWDQDDPHELPGKHCFLPGQAPASAPCIPCSLRSTSGLVYLVMYLQTWMMILL